MYTRWNNFFASTVFFAKIAWCVSSNFQRGEFNLFLWEQQAHPPLWLFFCQNCMACESQTYEVNPILFLKCSEPLSSYDLFLPKLYGTWDSTINKVNSILFCKHRNSSTPLTCFCENYIMPESNVNKVNPILFASTVSTSAPMICIFFCKNCILHESQT